MFGWLKHILPSYENEKFLRDIKRRAFEREEDRRADRLVDKIVARLKAGGE